MSSAVDIEHLSIPPAPEVKSGFWGTLKDWVTTVDHKKIAILYVVWGLFFFVLGGVEAVLIRLQLIRPLNDFLSADMYNQVMTMHGTTMIFFVAMPLLFGLINAVMPLQIGARDVAFPALNAFSVWLFVFGGIILNIGFLFGGAPNAGWFAYAPLTLPDYNPTPGIDYYNLGLQVAGIGTLIGGINFLTTIINMRAPGMTWMRLPMFTWTAFVTSAMILFAFPPLTINLFLLMFDRIFDANFFNVAGGGNIFLWQHLFWIFGHPEVYILILPAFGVFSEVITTFSKKRLFGYHSMVFATILIGFIGFMVWIHHMFTAGFSPVVNSIFAVSSMIIAIPTGIKIFNWLFTMWGGQLRFTTAMLFAAGFIPTFVMGGVTGVMLAAAPADYQYHDTYFVVAHFHYVIIGGVVFGIFAGLYYWWPKMFGRMLNERLGQWHFWLFLIGFHMTFLIQHFLGLLGMPRRVYTFKPDMGFDTMNLISTVGVFFMTAGMLAFAVNILVSWRSGVRAEADPWNGRTLEWAVSSPAPEYNFAQLPLVRGLDALWVEKMAGNREMVPAEPQEEHIHMPSPTYWPFILALSISFVALGAIFRSTLLAVFWLPVVLAFTVAALLDRNEGHHVRPEKAERARRGA